MLVPTNYEMTQMTNSLITELINLMITQPINPIKIITTNHMTNKLYIPLIGELTSTMLDQQYLILSTN